MKPSFTRVAGLARVALIAVLLVTFAGLPGVAPAGWALPTAGTAYAAKIDAGVWKAVDAAPDGKASVLIKLADQAELSAAAGIEDWTARGWYVYNTLRATADRTQPAVLDLVAAARAAGHVTNSQAFWIVNAIQVTADATAIRALAALPEVGTILPNLKLEKPVVTPGDTVASPTTVEWGIAKINAPAVWAAYNNGAGAVAANVDTGVDYTHPALVNQYRGNLGGGTFDHNYNWFDPTFANPAPVAVEGDHGTHVMGTEVGDDGGTNQIGVAPGAKWIAAFGCCPDNATLLEAQQFMVAPTDLAGNNPDPSKRPDVLNQSWGGPGGSQIFEPVIAALRASGIFPAFSAGNNGSSAANGCGRLGSPGDNPLAFNAAATDISDNAASFSSRGPNPFTGEVGPNVAAPGVNVRSSIPGGGYANYNGTSMASPHVAGSVALLISVEPKLRGRIDELTELLRKTAVPLTSTQTCGGVAGSEIPNNVFGWGRIDVKAAADMVWQAGYIEGLVHAGATPIAGATVTYSMLGKTISTTTDADGRYKVVAGAGSWSMTAGAYGYGTGTAGSVSVTQNNTTVQDFDLAALGSFTLSGNVNTPLDGNNAAVMAMVLVKNEKLASPVWSDASGNYSLSLPVGTYTVEVSHPGFDTASQTVVISGNTSQNFTLTPRGNYACLDNRQPGGPVYTWIDATDGTAYNLDDDASTADITLPQPFTYFGTPYTTVRINSNGFVFFGTTNYTAAHMVLPFEGRPNTDAMAFGEDLNPALGTQGVVYGKTVGTLFIAEFYQVQHWASGFPETFEIILDTSNGTITYQYNTVSWPDYTSVGLEDAAGAVGQLYSYANSADLQPGRAVQFTPAGGNTVNWGCDHALTLTADDDKDPVTTGEMITYRLHWNVIGFGGAPNAVLTATVPPNTTFVSAAGGITPVAGVLTWNLGNLRPKSEAGAWFKVTANAGPVAMTTVTLTDGGGQTRSASAQTTITGQPTAVGLRDLGTTAATHPWGPIAALSLLLVAGAWTLRRQRAG